MANPSSHASGTQSATVTTEHSLTTITVAGTYQLEVDLSAMVAGDSVEIRWKSKTLTGGTQRGGDVSYRDGAQPAGKLQFLSDYIPNLNTDAASVEFTLKQTLGTSRSFPWQVFKYT